MSCIERMSGTGGVEHRDRSLAWNPAGSLQAFFIGFQLINIKSLSSMCYNGHPADQEKVGVLQQGSEDNFRSDHEGIRKKAFAQCDFYRDINEHTHA